MNTSHYPSLELGKKLTEIGFPETEKVFAKLVQFKKDDPEHEISDRYQDMLGECVWDYVCPSVMEMLDVMMLNSKTYKIEIDKFCNVAYVQLYEVKFFINGIAGHIIMNGNLPNALAEMVIWLHQNNYISFNK